MRFFNRRKKNSPGRYSNNYGNHGVVPDTIEYYLEFGHEVEAEDIYWDVPDNATIKDEAEGEDGDGNITFSYNRGNIPVLTIVDASTNIPITSTVYHHQQTTKTDETPSENATKKDSKVDDDIVEPFMLETTLSEYEGVSLHHQDSMGGKSYCTISTVGFKSVAASVAAAQEFASNYVRYKPREEPNVGGERNGNDEAGEQGIHAEEEESQVVVKTDTLTSLNSKSIIAAPRKNPSGTGTLHPRITLHADEAGEQTAAMTRDTFFPTNIINPMSTFAATTGCSFPSPAVAATAVIKRFKLSGTTVTMACAQDTTGIAMFPRQVANSEKIVDGNDNPRFMTSLLDDDLSSFHASNTARSNGMHSSTTTNTKSNIGSLLRKPSWFRRQRTNSTHPRPQFDDSSTIPTRAPSIADHAVEEKESTISSIDSPPRDQEECAADGSSPQLKDLVFPEAPLVVLYDDKRNHVAWLRCAPRRRNFEYPFLPATTETVVVTTPTMRSLSLAKREGIDAVSPGTSSACNVIGTDDHAAAAAAATAAHDGDDDNDDNDNDGDDNAVTRSSFSSPTMTDVEYRDPPITTVAVLDPTVYTSERTDSEPGSTIVKTNSTDCGRCADENFTKQSTDTELPEIKKSGSTITEYKRKLADLQRRHDAVMKLMQGMVID
jgi:hypothetical protein